MNMIEDKKEELEQYMFNSFNQRQDLTRMITGYGKIYVSKCKQEFFDMNRTIGYYAGGKGYSTFLNELVNDVRYHIENEIINNEYNYTASFVKCDKEDMGKLKYLLTNLQDNFGLTLHDFYRLYGGLLGYIGSIPMDVILHPSIPMFEPHEQCIELWEESILSVVDVVKTTCLLSPNVKGIQNYHDVLTVSDGMLGSDVFIEEAKEYALNKHVRNKYIVIKVKDTIDTVIDKVTHPTR